MLLVFPKRAFLHSEHCSHFFSLVVPCVGEIEVERTPSNLSDPFYDESSRDSKRLLLAEHQNSLENTAGGRRRGRPGSQSASRRVRHRQPLVAPFRGEP